jgi:hypothetical protein
LSKCLSSLLVEEPHFGQLCNLSDLLHCSNQWTRTHLQLERSSRSDKLHTCPARSDACRIRTRTYAYARLHTRTYARNMMMMMMMMMMTPYSSVGSGSAAGAGAGSGAGAASGAGSAAGAGSGAAAGPGGVLGTWSPMCGAIPIQGLLLLLLLQTLGHGTPMLDRLLGLFKSSSSSSSSCCARPCVRCCPTALPILAFVVVALACQSSRSSLSYWLASVDWLASVEIK